MLALEACRNTALPFRKIKKLPLKDQAYLRFGLKYGKLLIAIGEETIATLGVG
jgi:hypothetical protein